MNYILSDQNFSSSAFVSSVFSLNWLPIFGLQNVEKKMKKGCVQFWWTFYSCPEELVKISIEGLGNFVFVNAYGLVTRKIRHILDGFFAK